MAIGANDLFVLHSAPGYQSFLRTGPRYGKEWMKFTGMKDLIPNDCDDEMDSSREGDHAGLPREDDTTNTQTLLKTRELHTSDTDVDIIPFTNVDFAPAKILSMEVSYDLPRDRPQLEEEDPQILKTMEENNRAQPKCLRDCDI